MASRIVSPEPPGPGVQSSPDGPRDIIDAEGFRLSIGIVICNHQGQVLWARRIRQNSWQFPQGGIDPGEGPEEAMFRELGEELGLEADDVQVLEVSHQWLHYRLPKRLVRNEGEHPCIGQKQKWFLLKLTHGTGRIAFNRRGHPEFDDWCWVSYWYPIRQVISFKRDVYRCVLTEFAPRVMYSGRGGRANANS